MLWGKWEIGTIHPCFKLNNIHFITFFFLFSLLLQHPIPSPHWGTPHLNICDEAPTLNITEAQMGR